VTQTMTLDQVLDLRAAAALKENLLAVRGEDVTLDASDVQRLGGQCLQVLLSAKRTWDADGRIFTISPQSELFAASLKLFGAEAISAHQAGN
jgi:chemotaxis protein CheX